MTGCDRPRGKLSRLLRSSSARAPIPSRSQRNCVTSASMCMVGSSRRLRQQRQQNHPQQTKRPQRPSKVSRQRAIDFARRAFIRLPRAVSISRQLSRCARRRARTRALSGTSVEFYRRSRRRAESPWQSKRGCDGGPRSPLRSSRAASRSLATRERRGVSIVRKQLGVASQETHSICQWAPVVQRCHKSESGGGFFPARFFASFRPVMAERIWRGKKGTK